MTLFRTLASRIFMVAALACVAVLLLGTLILTSSYRTREAFASVSHTHEVISGLDTLRNNLGRAESGLRGFLLTREEEYLEGFEADTQQAYVLAGSLAMLVADNPVQRRRALQLQGLTAQKIAFMRRGVDDARANAPVDTANRARGRTLMRDITRLTGIMQAEERKLLSMRTQAAEVRVDQSRALLLYGCPILVLLIAGIAWLIRNSISRPLADLLDVVTRFGAGERDARAKTNMGSAEFRRLARAYNGMAEHLVQAMDQQSRAELQLAHANLELVQRGKALEERQHSVQLLSEMSHRLQAIQHEGELAEVLDCFLPQVLPDHGGVLYVHNHSRNMLMRVSAWNEPQAAPPMFAPTECWGLRRGQTHYVERPGADLVCTHAADAVAVERICEPVLAGGEVLGLLYVEGAMAEEQRFRLDILMENVALALVNDNLRSRLREQSIRDPLTKLFNRRYMEEALALEAARAERSGADLTIVMCDIDHFKRFNDGQGHQAGDILLAAVAGLIQSHFRPGDIVCRYGGEEFTVIAPGASASLIQMRVEALRQAVREMTVEYHGQRLGPVTMSFGIDTWSAGDTRTPASVVSEADRALFRAKRLGRDRAEVAAPSTRTQAAE